MPRENDQPTTNPPVAKSTRRWPIVVSLLTLAAPMLLGQAGQVLLQLTDTLLIGHVGAVELAAASLAGNFVMFALYFAYGAVGAVSPTIAQLHGAGDSLGSIEVGKEASFFAATGDILDIRSEVKRLWISGAEQSLASRHSRLAERYRTRPAPLPK